MRKPLIACLLAAGLTLVVAQGFRPASLGAQSAQSDIHGTWTAELHSGRVFLQVNTAAPPDWNRNGDWNGGWNMGQTFDVSDISGLPGNDDNLTASTVKFELRREAGTLGFEGQFRDGRGAGLFTFAPRDAYVNEMRSLGFKDDLPLWRRYQLAVHDVGPKYVRDLKSEGFNDVTLDQIQRARTHGVTIDYIKAMKAEGFREARLEEFVRTRDHGVTKEYIDGMKQAGFANAPIEDLVRAKDHGVTPDFVKEIKGLGLSAPNLEGYIRLHDHGVRTQLVTEMKTAGYDKLSTEELIRAHDHGVTPAYVKDLAAQGFKNLAIEDVVHSKDHGVTADYIADMREINKNLTLDQLTRLRDHGITPGFVNHAKARGYNTTDPDEWIRLRNTGFRDR